MKLLDLWVENFPRFLPSFGKFLIVPISHKHDWINGCVSLLLNVCLFAQITNDFESPLKITKKINALQISRRRTGWRHQWMNVAMRADVRKLTACVVRMSGDTSVPVTRDIISSPLIASVSFHSIVIWEWHFYQSCIGTANYRTATTSFWHYILLSEVLIISSAILSKYISQTIQ